jgi:hypothetical protein
MGLRQLTWKSLFRLDSDPVNRKKTLFINDLRVF